jgi:ATP-dependent DNA helicase 2 subunit 1
MLELCQPSDPKKDDADSAVSAAVKCAYSIMQQRIISNPNDMMGILLYGTEQTKLNMDPDSSDSLAYPHCYMLTDLAVPSAEDVRKLRKLVDDPKEFGKIMVPSKERVALQNVFFCVNQVFATQAANFASRRLFLVTDNDNPHDSKEMRETASVRAKDLYDLGIIIELFPIAPPKGDFDKSKFYNVSPQLKAVSIC